MSIAVLVVLAFLCETVDSALGMGYGTTLTPILLLLGYPPLLIVPTILFSEFISGLLAGLFHHSCGNISLRRKSRDWRVIGVLGATGAIGAVVAVFVAVNISKVVLKGYIGAMVLAMGLLVLLLRRKTFAFSWRRIFGLGLLSAFNKGMSGGGYGPLVVSGQILSGNTATSSIGVTSMAESIICAVGFSLYLGLNRGFAWFPENWTFALPIVAGAAVAAPVAAWTTKVVSRRVDLRLIVGVLTSVLGAWTLWNTFGHSI